MQLRRRNKMQSPWFGGIIMLILVVGLVVWLWWAMKQNKEK
jgi:cobalamin biosynthesis Mg chelatase CobN